MFGDTIFRGNLEYILLIDKVTQTNLGQRGINEAIRDTLKSMQTQRSSIIDQTITALRHSNNNVVAGIAGVARLGKFGHDISKASEFAEDFCDSFRDKISYIRSQLPTMTEVLQKELNTKNESNVDAARLITLLEQNNVIAGTKVADDYKAKLVSSEFAEYKNQILPINRFLAKVSVASESRDASINGLQHELTKIVSKSLMGEIRHHISNPIAHEGVHQSGLISKISDNIETGINNLRDALRSVENTEGSIIIDLNSDQYPAVSNPKVGDGKNKQKHKTTKSEKPIVDIGEIKLEQSCQKLKIVIDYEVDNKAILPNDLTSEQEAKAFAIRMEVNEHYGELEPDVENKIVALAYKLNKKYEATPGSAPNVEVASLGGIANLGVRLVGNQLTAAIRVAAGKYLYNIISPELSKIGVDIGLIDDYNQLKSDIFEKTKISGDKTDIKYKELASCDEVSFKMPSPGDLEPDDDKPEWKKGCSKAESPVWKELKHHKGKYKTNGQTGGKARCYEWDSLHNEIEVYGPKGIEHLGAICPKTGKFIKLPKPGRTIKDLIN